LPIKISGVPLHFSLKRTRGGFSQWSEEMLEELEIELWVGDRAWIRGADYGSRRLIAMVPAGCFSIWKRIAFPESR
jgi:hypothetical protein